MAAHRGAGSSGLDHELYPDSVNVAVLVDAARQRSFLQRHVAMHATTFRRATAHSNRRAIDGQLQVAAASGGA
jgi:hypothetical protein